VPYIHIASQMFGDRMLVANATGCTSIYSGTFPTSPYAKDSNGRGPAWANSLFEDNAEYGFGMRLAVDANRRLLKSAVSRLAEGGGELGEALKKQLSLWDELTAEAKQNADKVRSLLESAKVDKKLEADLQIARALGDWLIDRSIWIVGGDGWAYDIGYGGLDHVMASNRNVNVLVLDTEVYSNTGGQSSKATPRGAVAKFAASGKKTGKKNLGLMMTTYGTAFVASINLGANREQALEAIAEAERHKGPSIVIAYSPCIAHGYKMALGMKQSKLAEATGYWPIYRYDPNREEPFIWDTKDKSADFRDYVQNEVRYRTLQASMPEEAERLFQLAIQDNERRFHDLMTLADGE
jgi:pyruvate-ferredoxin/flavodoxin oxidoreductase